jgi:hypothetical protein
MYRGDDEARALSRALFVAAERGERVPCDGIDPATIRPSTCAACPIAVRGACGDYGRAAGIPGTFGGVWFGLPHRSPEARRNGPDPATCGT